MMWDDLDSEIEHNMIEDQLMDMRNETNDDAEVENVETLQAVGSHGL
jgi:hypothetical protein